MNSVPTLTQATSVTPNCRMELFHGNDARSDELSRPLVATLLLLGNTFLAGLLIWAARLRETPLFWRNAGGYSEGLRDWVKIGSRSSTALISSWLPWPFLSSSAPPVWRRVWPESVSLSP